MRKRLLLSFAFGLLGLALALPLGGRLGLSTPVSLIAFTTVGIFLGYIASIFFDVFFGDAGQTEPEN